ncbi:hypothetical protein Tco_0499024 [Tanacetum coccineum]
MSTFPFCQLYHYFASTADSFRKSSTLLLLKVIHNNSIHLLKLRPNWQVGFKELDMKCRWQCLSVIESIDLKRRLTTKVQNMEKGIRSLWDDAEYWDDTSVLFQLLNADHGWMLTAAETQFALQLGFIPSGDKSSDSETTGFASCASGVNSSSTMTNASSSADLKNLHKTDDQGPSNDTQSPSFSFMENVKTPRNLYCDFYENQLRLNNASVWKDVENIPSFVPRPAYVHTGSRNRPTSVPAGRPFPAGWHNPAARPMTRPKSHYVPTI